MSSALVRPRMVQLLSRSVLSWQRQLQKLEVATLSSLYFVAWAGGRSRVFLLAIPERIRRLDLSRRWLKLLYMHVGVDAPSRSPGAGKFKATSSGRVRTCQPKYHYTLQSWEWKHNKLSKVRLLQFSKTLTASPSLFSPSNLSLWN